jgi:hypothetical protein
MPQLILGFAAAWLALWLIKQFANTSPQAYRRIIRAAGGQQGLFNAVFNVLRARSGPIGLVASALMWFVNQQQKSAGAARGAGFDGFRWGGFGSNGASKASSATVEVELDHQTGDMVGRATSGPYGGRDFAQMTRDELLAMLSWCAAQDPEGARLLEAYLDRRFPGWRPAGEGEAHAGRSRPAGAGMSEDEAHQILGLTKGAGPEEITRAHRELMKKAHPDAGGSSELAARLNEAKSILMRRHRP